MDKSKDIVAELRETAEFLAFIGCINDSYTVLAETVRAAAALIEKLPLTADGVRVVPGVDYVYGLLWNGLSTRCAVTVRDYGSLEDEMVSSNSVPRHFSTPEAALASTPTQ